MEIQTVLAPLQHYPRRYHDRTKRAEIAELTTREAATAPAPVYWRAGKAEVFAWQRRKLAAACPRRSKPRGCADRPGTELRDEAGGVDGTGAYRGSHGPETEEDNSCADERLNGGEFGRM